MAAEEMRSVFFDMNKILFLNTAKYVSPQFSKFQKGLSISYTAM